MMRYYNLANMNVEKIKGKKYIQKYETPYLNKKIDFIKNKYPVLKNRKHDWHTKLLLCKKLLKIQKNLEEQKKVISIKNNSCPLCNKENIETKEYVLKDVHWYDSLFHYIFQHNYKPSKEFIEFIISHYVSILSNGKINLPTITYKRNEKKYTKISKNQLQILDALMNNGGYIKKYESDNNDYKYSEHSGTFVFNDGHLSRLIVSSENDRIDKDDSEIYLPINMSEAYDSEYIFHTHPPTPTPGGRVSDGILFEPPSGNDVLHFIEHNIIGLTKGSIVITPEGLYLITTINHKARMPSNKKKFRKKMSKINHSIQKNYISKWGKSFSADDYYNKIIQDIHVVDLFNDFLIKYGIKIDYYPRKLNKQGLWFLDDIYVLV